MTYNITFSIRVEQDLLRLAKSEPKVFAKANRLIRELETHPRHPEPLKGKPEGRWSRELTKKHRLIYRIFETEVYVEILSAYGHYNDK